MGAVQRHQGLRFNVKTGIAPSWNMMCLYFIDGILQPIGPSS